MTGLKDILRESIGHGLTNAPALAIITFDQYFHPGRDCEVERREDRHGGAAPRTDGTEDVGPFVASVARCARPRSAFGPDAGQRALLADPRFVLEPDFDRLVFGAVGELRRDRRGEVFLNASWAASSVWGWR